MCVFEFGHPTTRQKTNARCGCVDWPNVSYASVTPKPHRVSPLRQPDSRVEHSVEDPIGALPTALQAPEQRGWNEWTRPQIFEIMDHPTSQTMVAPRTKSVTVLWPTTAHPLFGPFRLCCELQLPPFETTMHSGPLSHTWGCGGVP